jgi:hypothetical protein
LTVLTTQAYKAFNSRCVGDAGAGAGTSTVVPHFRDIEVAGAGAGTTSDALLLRAIEDTQITTTAHIGAVAHISAVFFQFFY